MAYKVLDDLMKKRYEEGKIVMLKQLIDSDIVSMDEGAKQMGVTKEVFYDMVKTVGNGKG